MATKQDDIMRKAELEAQIRRHKMDLERLEHFMEEMPKEIEQLKATIKLKQKALWHLP